MSIIFGTMPKPLPLLVFLCLNLCELCPDKASDLQGFHPDHNLALLGM